MELRDGSVAVVTGAGSGIGAALVEALRRRGCRVAACDVREGADEALQAAVGDGGLGARADVRDRDAVYAFAALVHDRLGPADLVIANAGVTHIGDALQSTDEDLQRVIDVNLWGVVHTVRAFAPAMVARGRGHLVTVSSIFGIIGVANQSAYCASKAAVRGFTEALDLELRGTGVGVTCVHPGAIATAIARDASRSRTTGRISTARGEELIAAGLPPSSAADRILSAVEADRVRLLIGRDARGLDLLQRLLPSHYRTLIHRFADRFLS